MKIFWISFAILFSLFEILVMYQYYRNSYSFNPTNLSEEVIRIISIIGIVYYGLKKKLLVKAIWQFVFIGLIINTSLSLFPLYEKFIHLNHIDLPGIIVYLITMPLLFIPLFIGIFLYAFKSKEIWRNTNENSK